MINKKSARLLEQGKKLTIIPPSQDFLERVGTVLDMSKFPMIAPDGNNEPFITQPFESQILTFFDSDGCNIFSGLHSVEMYANALGGNSYYGGRVDLSERWACKEAGLTPGSGSSEEQWETMITQKGAVRQDLWPVTENMTETEFFSPISQNIASEGLHFLTLYKPQIRQIGVDPESIREALKYGPVKIFIGTGTGWNQGRPFVIPKTLNPMGHAVLVTYMDTAGQFYIYDQYSPYLKILVGDYKIFFAFQTLLIPKNMTNVIPVHRAGTQEYGFYQPSLSIDALKDKALNFDLEILNPDGSVDFTKFKDISL